MFLLRRERSECFEQKRESICVYADFCICMSSAIYIYIYICVFGGCMRTNVFGRNGALWALYFYAGTYTPVFFGGAAVLVFLEISCDSAR